MRRMGYEYRVHFEINRLDSRTYAPDEFLAHLPDDVPSTDCIDAGISTSGHRVYEYRARDTHDEWPAVVITVEPTGFFILENDRRAGSALLGHVVKYALRFSIGERVIIEAA